MKGEWQGHTHCYLNEAFFGSQMERGVALVVEIGVQEPFRVIVHDPLHQRKVVEKNGAAKAPRNVDPASVPSAYSFTFVYFAGLTSRVVQHCW